MTPVPLDGYLKYLNNKIKAGNFENAVYANADKSGNQVYIDVKTRLSAKFKMIEAINHGKTVVVEEVKDALTPDDVNKVALQKFIMHMVNRLPKTFTMFQIGIVTDATGDEYLYIFALDNAIFQWIKDHSSEIDKIYFSKVEGSLIPENGLYVTSEVSLYPDVKPAVLNDTVTKEVYHGILENYMSRKN